MTFVITTKIMSQSWRISCGYISSLFIAETLTNLMHPTYSMCGTTQLNEHGYTVQVFSLSHRSWHHREAKLNGAVNINKL